VTEPVSRADELPPPDTHCFDDDTGRDVWSYSADQMRAYAAAAVAVERERIHAKLLEMHERDGARHNYWLCAWRELSGE
jgi:hypothetical protein